MNPIPLAAPDGQVYAYACSHCRHVGGGSSLLCPPPSDGPHEILVESSLSDATRCCICPTCSAVMPLNYWGWECAACKQWHDFCFLWHTLTVWHGRTQAEWDAHFVDDEDDDD